MAPTKQAASPSVPTQVKDPDLVAERRRQIVDAAVVLFIEKGFHRTTTREIAQAVGFSIGSLYEYVTSKQDVLYLVCEAIHADMIQGVQKAVARAGGAREGLAEMIREYFLVCRRLADPILLIYQEAKSLPTEYRRQVFENEVRVTGLFVEALNRLVDEGHLPAADPSAIELMAHNIVVWGHMWSFRGWYLERHMTIDEYIEQQTALVWDRFNGLAQKEDRRSA